MINMVSFREMEVDNEYTREVLVLSINEKTARNGKPFTEIELSDGESTITARKFDTSKKDLAEEGVEAETVALTRIKVNTYNNDKSYMIEWITESSSQDVSVDDFIPKPDADLDKLWMQLICNVETCHTPSERDDHFEPISEFTLRVLKTHKCKFMTAAAGRSIHHNKVGGLLMHTAAMVQEAMYVAVNYPSLDRELLVCGAALHDIGKIREMKTSKLGKIEYTSEGRLLGHSLIGAMMLEDFTVDWPEKYALYDLERVTLLQHMIASHHGIPEYGAIVEPAIPEAAVLHALDMMDSRIYIFNEAYKEVEPGELSKNIYALKNTVYKPKEMAKRCSALLPWNEDDTVPQDDSSGPELF